VYFEPLDGVGGRGSPRTTVRSAPFPPLGPIIWYCPDLGAGVPGVKPLRFDIDTSVFCRLHKQHSEQKKH